MTRQKDLKRLVRSRMQKTGESYTSAKRQIRRQSGAVAKVPPARYAVVAGMSDGAVEKRTGKTWTQWVKALDRDGMATLSHREIARHVHERYEGVSDWWSQMITVSYERIKGLRDVGQRRNGTYDAGKSKTFPVSVSKLYRAWSDKRTRVKWLPEDVVIRTSAKDKSMRLTWPDGTIVVVQFTGKAPAKSTVTVQHGGLATKADLTRAKAVWAERFAALGALLA